MRKFIDERIKKQTEQQDAFESMLKKYFATVVPVYLPTSWHYIDAQELVQKLKDIFPEQEKFIDANEEILSIYFSKKIEEEGEIVVQIKSLFWKCRL